MEYTLSLLIERSEEDIEKMNTVKSEIEKLNNKIMNNSIKRVKKKGKPIIKYMH